GAGAVSGPGADDHLRVPARQAVRADRRPRGLTAGSHPEAATATPFRALRLTAYMAASAARKRPSASVACCGAVATPRLAVTSRMSTAMPSGSGQAATATLVRSGRPEEHTSC